MRQSEIRGYAIRYLDNVAKNNGKCKYGFMAGLVREASSKNNALQIDSRAIENKAERIVARQRKVSRELSGTTKASIIINEPLHVDDPRVNDLQVSVCINILDHAAANPQPQPLVAGEEVEVNEASVVTTEDYFLYRMGVIVPRTVTHVQFHSSVKCVQAFSSIHQDVFFNCTTLVKVVLNNGLERIGELAFNHCTELLIASYHNTR
jgi:hypothetical protein